MDHTSPELPRRGLVGKQADGAPGALLTAEALLALRALLTLRTLLTAGALDTRNALRALLTAGALLALLTAGALLTLLTPRTLLAPGAPLALLAPRTLDTRNALRALLTPRTLLAGLFGRSAELTVAVPPAAGHRLIHRFGIGGNHTLRLDHLHYLELLSRTLPFATISDDTVAALLEDPCREASGLAPRQRVQDR